MGKPLVGVGVRGFSRFGACLVAAALLVACGTDGERAPEPPRPEIAATESPLAVPSAMKIDVGDLPSVSNSWTTVTLSRAYTSMVVIATPSYTSSSVPLVTRVRNAAGSSFEIRVDRFDKGTTAVPAVSVHYLAVEEGAYTAATHGIKMEAVRYASTVTDRTGSWNGEARAYRQSYTNPVVLGQVMSYADARPSVFWSRGSSSSAPPSATALRVGKHVGEDPATTRANETVGYVVVEAGTGSLGGITWEARLGADLVTDVTTLATRYPLTAPGPTTVAVLSQSAMDGTDGSWALLAGPGATSGSDLAVFVDEDNAKDAERSHQNEQVAYFTVNQCPTALSAGQKCGIGGACAADRTCCADADGDGVCNAVDACAGFDDHADTDHDGRADGCDACPSDPGKTATGACGCGVADADSDGDGTANCNDLCPTDPQKTAVGACGCGVSDVDADGDGVPSCNDGCPADPGKTASGACGCGIADTDSDADGTANCNDACASDPTKVAPGACGCGTADTDSDGDGTPNCNDACPTDPTKTLPGICGCGAADADSDGDGMADCNDGCPSDAAKTAPGACGCGTADTDSDGDGAPNCHDGCPSDAAKTAPGACGCGAADTDSDGDGAPNCHDGCPSDAAKTAPGACGCGTADTDSDGDGTPNCHDACPSDNPDDSDGDGTCNGVDRCPGFDDRIDTDHNGVVDGCQQCFTVADCDDHNECTTSACSASGQCTYVPVPAPAPTTWTNGDFEKGSFTGFTTYTTTSGAATFLVEPFQTAPGVTSFAGRMIVGRASGSGTIEGGGIKQQLQINAGSLTVSANVASVSPTSSNSDGGTMMLYVDNTLLQTKAFGSVSTGVVYRATLTGTIPAITAGTHEIRVETRRLFTTTATGVRNYVDDITFSGTSVPPVTSCSSATGGTCDASGTCVACPDSDADGVCNANDICAGFDDHVDPDGDGKPTGCDACPSDNPNDSDSDTVCNGVDQCPGFDDRVDADHNGVPDGCQECVTAANCNDGNPCTADACVATHCTHPVTSGAVCGAQGTCDASGTCTNEACQFIPLGDLAGGGFNSSAYAVSDDGQTVTGRGLVSTTAYAAFRWKQSTGMVKIGSGTTSSGRAISGDGTIVAGIGGSEVNRSSSWAFRERPGWVETTGTGSEAFAMSADGSIVVGDTNLRAFRWGPAGSPTDMGLGSSSAMGISADGSIIVGRGTLPARPSVGEAFIWTATSVIGLGDFAGGSAYNSEARGISPDGTRVVGVAAGVSQQQGFTWTAGTGMVSLGNNIAPFAVSNDNTIVGGNGSAWVSSPRIGTGDLRFLLQTCGVTTLGGWNLVEMRDVTPDGRTMVGTGFNPSGNDEAVLVRLR